MGNECKGNVMSEGFPLAFATIVLLVSLTPPGIWNARHYVRIKHAEYVGNVGANTEFSFHDFSGTEKSPVATTKNSIAGINFTGGNSVLEKLTP